MGQKREPRNQPKQNEQMTFDKMQNQFSGGEIVFSNLQKSKNILKINTTFGKANYFS